MSSEHIIVVARNTVTGAIELPLDDLTLYGTGGEQDMLETCRRDYDDDWVLALYRPMTPGFTTGAMPRAAPPTDE